MVTYEKLISLSTVMVSGGFASRLGQAFTANRSRIFNAGAAAACYAYGPSITETQPQGIENVYIPKAANFVLAAALARNACRKQSTICGAIQGFSGANLINSGWADFKNADSTTHFIKRIKKDVKEMPAIKDKDLPYPFQSFLNIISSMKNKPNTTYPLHSEASGLHGVLCGSVLFISRPNPVTGLIAIGSWVMGNCIILGNAIVLESSHGKQNLLAVLTKAIKSQKCI